MENPTFDDKAFRRRYRISKDIFYRIEAAIMAASDEDDNCRYFKQRPDATGMMGIPERLKITVALRQLAYNLPADLLEETYGVSERVGLQSLKMFCRSLVFLFGKQYLRKPTEEDLQRIYEESERRGVPGCIGSVDCMHVYWRNCPTAWKGAFSGKEKEPTIVLEAVADWSRWIWHAFFGLPGINNDKTVLAMSDLLQYVASIKAPYTLHGHVYDTPYFLADGIYPAMEVFATPMSQPRTPADRNYNSYQEAYRKDIECSFGILQAKFGILRDPVRLWSLEDIDYIVLGCVILHNMVVESRLEEMNYELGPDELPVWTHAGNEQDHAVERPDAEWLSSQMQNLRSNRAAFDEHQARLINHLWNYHGNR